MPPSMPPSASQPGTGILAPLGVVQKVLAIPVAGFPGISIIEEALALGLLVAGGMMLPAPWGVRLAGVIMVGALAVHLERKKTS